VVPPQPGEKYIEPAQASVVGVGSILDVVKAYKANIRNQLLVLDELERLIKEQQGFADITSCR